MVLDASCAQIMHDMCATGVGWDDVCDLLSGRACAKPLNFSSNDIIKSIPIDRS